MKFFCENLCICQNMKEGKICLRLSDSIYGVKYTLVIYIYEIIHIMLEHSKSVNEVVAVRQMLCAEYSECSFSYC